jgi:hypothetical protein
MWLRPGRNFDRWRRGLFRRLRRRWNFGRRFRKLGLHRFRLYRRGHGLGGNLGSGRLGLRFRWNLDGSGRWSAYLPLKGRVSRSRLDPIARRRRFGRELLQRLEVQWGEWLVLDRTLLDFLPAERKDLLE